MIRDSINYSNRDKQLRKLAEQKVEAARVLETLQSALDKDADLLDEEELNLILNAKRQLQQAAESNDCSLIEQRIKIVDDATQTFAAKRMNRSIRDALTGHSVDDI